MKSVLIFYFLIINAIGLVLMYADKQFARKNLWRIPEATLFTAALLGGSIGSLAGMYLFRHKTKHWQFVLGIPLILAGQIALLILLLF